MQKMHKNDGVWWNAKIIVVIKGRNSLLPQNFLLTPLFEEEEGISLWPERQHFY